MIVHWEHDDVAPLLSLWLESTIAGHPFIEERYWHESQPLVQEVISHLHKPGSGTIRR